MSKLCAVYNAWDGIELLEHSINSVKDHIDLFIFVWQKHSNYGEYFDPYHEIIWIAHKHKIKYIAEEYTPNIALSGGTNETNKRNAGLRLAKENKCSHFMFIDCDEMYENFGEAKWLYEFSGAAGSVCKMFTYWGKPTYQLNPIEDYYVPFIHELKENTVAGMQDYPFYCDPTRLVNEQNVVELPVMMHHFSWVRKDIERKIRNSSARKNIERSSYIHDYRDLMKTSTPEGHYLPGIGRRIKIVPNIFSISL